MPRLADRELHPCPARLIVSPAYYALRYMYGPGSRGIFSPNVDFMSVALLFLGLGSFVFHASLRATLEFADEFAMLGLVWSMLQVSFTARQPPAAARLITVGLAVYFTSFIAFYLQSPQIIYQVIAFTSSIFLVLLRSQYLFHRIRPAFPEAKTREWNVRTWKAIVICLVGYGLWNIDLEFCAQLRSLRYKVGLPWAWALELHGWWHVLTAIGASQFMDIAREVRHEESLEAKKQ